jgi:hypothetical protein
MNRLFVTRFRVNRHSLPTCETKAIFSAAASGISQSDSHGPAVAQVGIQIGICVGAKIVIIIAGCYE